MRGYVVIVEGDDQSGYSAYAPELSGVVAAAPSRAETELLMRAAVADHLVVLQELGLEASPPVDATDVIIIDPAAA